MGSSSQHPLFTSTLNSDITRSTGSPLRSPQADPSPARWSWRSWKAPTGSRPKGPSGSWNHSEGGPGQARTRGTPRPPRQLQPRQRADGPFRSHHLQAIPPADAPPTPQACLLGLQSSHLDSQAVPATAGLLGPWLEHPPSVPFFLQPTAPWATKQEADGRPACIPCGRPGVLHAGVSQAESWGPAGVRLDFGRPPLQLPGTGKGRPAVWSGLRKTPGRARPPPQEGPGAPAPALQGALIKPTADNSVGRRL